MLIFRAFQSKLQTSVSFPLAWRHIAYRSSTFIGGSKSLFFISTIRDWFRECSALETALWAHSIGEIRWGWSERTLLRGLLQAQIHRSGVPRSWKMHKQNKTKKQQPGSTKSLQHSEVKGVKSLESDKSGSLSQVSYASIFVCIFVLLWLVKDLIWLIRTQEKK